MGRAYVELLDDQHRAAVPDAELRRLRRPRDPGARARRATATLVKEVTRLSGAAPEEVWQFFSHGMLLNVIASLDLQAIAEQDEWARAWCEPGELIRRRVGP